MSERNPGISIVVRTNRTNLDQEIVTIREHLTNQTEVIVVSGFRGRLFPESYSGIKQVKHQGGRFEALKIGVEKAFFDSVLFLDDDQVLERGLLEELRAKSDDAVIIPERSLNRNLIGRLMDLKRAYLEAVARERPVPEIAAIPRFFKKAALIKAFERLSPETLRVIVQHEDSILYDAAYDFCQTISMSKRRIFNADPDMFSFVMKAYRYGRTNEIAISSGLLTQEQIRFMRVLDRSRFLYDRDIGLNSGILIDILKGVPYLVGSLSYALEEMIKGE